MIKDEDEEHKEDCRFVFYILE